MTIIKIIIMIILNTVAPLHVRSLLISDKPKYFPVKLLYSWNL